MNLSGLLNFFRRSASGTRPKGAHMTFSESRAGRTITRTGMFLKKRIWIFPLIAVGILSLIGWGMRRAIETTMKDNLTSQLQTLLNVETAMLETWMRIQASNAETQANATQTRELTSKLLTLIDPTNTMPQPLKTSPLHRDLSKFLAPSMSAHDYHGYILADKSMKVLSATSEELVDEIAPKEYEDFLSNALQGQTTVSTPFPSVVTMKDDQGQLRTGVPTMFVCAPVRDESFQVVAALGLRIRPEKEFTRILQLGQLGNSGETFAFDKTGLMVSNSRFDSDLILLGLLPDHDHSKSILNVQLRDPGGNLMAGYRSKVRRSQLPLTKMVEQAIQGTSGVDVEGYADYRGVPVIGAWHWNEKYALGVATEIDYDEAYRPLSILQWTFWGLYALLGLCSLAIFIFSVVVARMQREAQKQAIASQKLGQYRLEQKLGSGGMGVVYKGFHAILRRPTAIKMLHVDKVNDGSIERFEREVQITCQLNNPNTVAIYDYGRTEEGVFYYAMEYLDGIDLQALVDKYGPQPESRVIHILQQVCGSLYEAHSLGLVHRDIKPANIMLNRRGGEPDVAKVLDFGLVKAVDEDKNNSMTAAGSLTGTPLYMSPEAIQTPQGVDARSDLYAVGAVGYFLLTGKAVFDAQNIVELCQAHVSKTPISPSERLGRTISQELESAILACLEKSRAKRPQTARDLALLLMKCPTANAWAIDEADAWWGRHERGETINTTLSGTRPAGATTAAAGAFERTYVTNTDGE
jgi:tRNA A-37 threonylcarbamoyl transferase component Bud32